MKRKTMTLVLCLLAALALVSVGFASWVISENDQKDLAGTISVETVQDKRLSVTVVWDGGEEANKFHFGKPNADEKQDKEEPTNPWLTFSTDTKESILKLSFTATVEYTGKQNISTEAVDVTAALSETTTLINKDTKYIVLPTNIDLNATLSSDGKSITYKGTIELKWGSEFGGMNPYYFYNDGTKTANTDGQKAKEALAAIYALNSAAFKLTVTATNK